MKFNERVNRLDKVSKSLNLHWMMGRGHPSFCAYILEKLDSNLITIYWDEEKGLNDEALEQLIRDRLISKFEKIIKELKAGINLIAQGE
jgi:hypothetical protein